MDLRSKKVVVGAAAVLYLLATTPAAQAQGFFSNFFGLFSGHRTQSPMMPLPYAGEENGNGVPENSTPRARYSYGGGPQAYCVRTCDGRHFPISGTSDQSRVASCRSFCPAAETKVVYGGNIDNAVTESGRPYSEMPNAFRYRDELVAGCSCNGKDAVGLAAVKLEDDPTLRRGDIVAGESGLMVAGRSNDRHGVALDLSPASKPIRSHYRRVPIVAGQ
jgi:hypothetical protein